MLPKPKNIFLYMDNGEKILLDEESTKEVLESINPTWDSGFSRKHIVVKTTDDKELIVFTKHISYIQ